MQRAWIVLVAGCWSASPAPPPSHGTTAPTAPTMTVGAGLQGIYRVRPPGWCGGARPPRDYRAPSLAPVAGATLQIFAGDRYDGGSPITEVVTDKAGRFLASLPPGQYCILRAKKGPKPTQGDPYHDLPCLVGEWHRCDLVAGVPLKSLLALDHSEGCSWSSACYNGPPPP